jgi:hypothetical protein
MHPAPQPPNVRLGKIDPLPDLVRNVLAAADKRPDDSALYDTLKTLFLEPGGWVGVKTVDLPAACMCVWRGERGLAWRLVFD